MSKKLYTDNIPGNLHEAAGHINYYGWSEYVVAMQFNGGHYTIAVFLMPEEMIAEIKSGEWWKKQRNR